MSLPLIRRAIYEAYAPYEIKLVKQGITGLHGRDVLLLGSGPSPDLTLFKDDMVVVTCNGSAANAKRLSLPTPTMTVVDYELLDPATAQSKPSRQAVVGNKLMADLDVGFLVAAQSNSSKGGDPAILQTRFRKYFELRRGARKRIVQSVTGMPLLERDVKTGLLSTGGFALALSFFLGCKSAVIAGFSLYKEANAELEPHFYPMDRESQPQRQDRRIDLSNIDTRNHSLADSALVTALCLNGHRVRTREIDFLPLVQNWGNTPPASLM